MIIQAQDIKLDIGLVESGKMKKIEADETNGHFNLEEFLQTGKHHINLELINIMKYRQARKWYVSLSILVIFMVVLLLMIYFIGQGKDLMPEWKEILLLMLGGFIASFSKVVDFWFNNQENDNKLLEHADDLGEK